MNYKEYQSLKLGDKIRDKRDGQVGKIKVLSRNEVYVAFSDDCLTSYCRDDYSTFSEFKEEISNIEKVKPLTIREKIIKRLNDGFGYNLPPDVKIKHHKGRMTRNLVGFSWYVYDTRVPFEVGSCCTMKECLKWKKWVIESYDEEIFEYNEKTMYEDTDYIEGVDNINFSKGDFSWKKF